MADLISTPPLGAVDTPDGSQVTGGWRNFFQAAYTLLLALSMSGTSAQRPTKGLWIGRPYFDKTLGYPIYWKGAIWVTAAGAPA